MSVEVFEVFTASDGMPGGRYRHATTAELLSALSESPDVVCGECENGLEYPSPSFSESHPLPVPCPVCGGSGLNPKLVEAMGWSFPSDWLTDDYHHNIGLAALRAFLSGGWTEESDG